MFTLDIANAKTAELIAFYNENSETPVKKFRNRKTAEIKTADLLAKLNEENAPEIAPEENPEKEPELSTREKRSLGVAKSWRDPIVAAKRRTRNGVDVDGVEYPSVYKAYLALGIDPKGHIPFRGLLKKEKTLESEGRIWTII